MTTFQGEWSQPRMTGMKVSGNDYDYSANYGASTSPRSMGMEGSRLEMTDPTKIDMEVQKQIEAGLIDANDIAGDATSADLENAPTQVFRRKVKKMVEVPVVRKVKVPTSNPQVVPDTIRQVIQVKKQVPHMEEKIVDEAYTDIEERPATRMKEVWVKKMVPEQYMKKIEVRKSRKVRVPVQTFREVTEDRTIEVETTKVEDQPGWRVDEIKDTKMVEIEGWQEVELVPRVKDTNIRIEKTYERQCPRRCVERKIGTNVMDDTDARLDNVDTDSDRDDAEVTSAGIVNLNGQERRTRPSKRVRTVRSHRFMTKGDGDEEDLGEVIQADLSVGATFDTAKFIPTPPKHTPRPPPAAPAAASAAPSPAFEAASTPRGTKMFGIRMKATKEGLSVSEVAPEGFADDAGLVAGDTIISVDGANITTVKCWRSALAGKMQGDFLTMVVKDSTGRSRPAAVKLDAFNPSHYI